MIKQLSLQGLRADLGQARQMLSCARQVSDLVAVMQFQHRVSELALEIDQLVCGEEPGAHVAIFFGGQPVLGSRGIDATFASKAIESFQRLLARHFAHSEGGSLGARGPIPVQDEARMVITDVVRGSFGFVLEEAPAGGRAVETQLRDALHQITESLAHLASDSNDWTDALEVLDERVVAELKLFFELLDDAGANIRIVEGDADRSLSQSSIQRARARIDHTTVTEEESAWIPGRLVGFSSKTFEFVMDSGEKVSGKIGRGPARQLEIAGEQSNIQQLIYAPVRARFNVRTVVNSTSSRRYCTLASVESTGEQSPI